MYLKMLNCTFPLWATSTSCVQCGNTSLYIIQTNDFYFVGKCSIKLIIIGLRTFGCWLELRIYEAIYIKAGKHACWIKYSIHLKVKYQSLLQFHCCVEMAFSYAALDKSLLYCSCFRLLINNFHNLCIFSVYFGSQSFKFIFFISFDSKTFS